MKRKRTSHGEVIALGRRIRWAHVLVWTGIVLLSMAWGCALWVGMRRVGG